jgi:hypothetical protein
MGSELLDKMDHDLTASIRNFMVAADLLESPSPNVRLAIDLLRASIEQLSGAQMLVRNEQAKTILNENNEPTMVQG